MAKVNIRKFIVKPKVKIKDFGIESYGSNGLIWIPPFKCTTKDKLYKSIDNTIKASLENNEETEIDCSDGIVKRNKKLINSNLYVYLIKYNTRNHQYCVVCNFERLNFCFNCYKVDEVKSFKLEK